MNVKLLVSMAGPDVSHNAGDEIDVDDATASGLLNATLLRQLRPNQQKKRLKKKTRASLRL